jgi:hypothetical protein
MRKFLYAVLAIATPLGVVVGLTHKVQAGEIADPIFFLLLVLVPTSLFSCVVHLQRVLPPARVRFVWREGIRAKHWEQALGGDPRHMRQITSLVVPIRLSNGDTGKSLTLFEMKVRDTLSGTVLAPPPPTRIALGDEGRWMYMACEMVFTEVFNSGDITLPPASFKDIALVTQENGTHRERYRLDVRFVDNYGRKYKEIMVLNVAEHGYQYETTEQVGGLPAQKSPAG